MATDSEADHAGAEQSTVDLLDQSEADSESGDDDSEDEQIEWLATGREKRSTAGNRLSSLIQQEGEDDELELLFAEADDDVAFSDADAADSDVQMEDSSDDEENQDTTAGVEDLEGEKELLRQQKAERVAKKRKANNGIPNTFRKKVKIDPTAPLKATPPRPKKKSERASWLPTTEDAPTRASLRGTTQKRKKELFAQMADREKKRKRLLVNMEKAAKLKEAEKSKEITQDDRLAEAARVEKRNAKSLNRWEEAEKIREEEQKAKLAALHNRKLEGPVITWWSGMAEFVDGKLRRLGKTVTIEEKKERKKKVTEVEPESLGTTTKQDLANAIVEQDSAGGTSSIVSNASVAINTPIQQPKSTAASESNPETVLGTPPGAQSTNEDKERNDVSTHTDLPPRLKTALDADATLHPVEIPASQSIPAEIHNTSHADISENPSEVPSGPELKERQTPDVSIQVPQTNQTSIYPITDGQPTSIAPPEFTVPVGHIPVVEHCTRTSLILENFNETAIKSKEAQTQVIFGRKFNKLPKPHPPPTCAITHMPAKFRDPATGLPYSSAYAYREIQKLRRGEYRWSSLLQAYVGQSQMAARGVPERFMKKPDKKM